MPNQLNPFFEDYNPSRFGDPSVYGAYIFFENAKRITSKNLRKEAVSKAVRSLIALPNLKATSIFEKQALIELVEGDKTKSTQAKTILDKIKAEVQIIIMQQEVEQSLKELFTEIEALISKTE